MNIETCMNGAKSTEEKKRPSDDQQKNKTVPFIAVNCRSSFKKRCKCESNIWFMIVSLHLHVLWHTEYNGTTQLTQANKLKSPKLIYIRSSVKCIHALFVCMCARQQYWNYRTFFTDILDQFAANALLFAYECMNELNFLCGILFDMQKILQQKRINWAGNVIEVRRLRAFRRMVIFEHKY